MNVSSNNRYWQVYQREAAWRNRSDASEILKSSTPQVSQTFSFDDAKHRQGITVQRDAGGTLASERPRSPSTATGGLLRIRLRREDSLVDAPSIGPKTSARFSDIGVHYVGEFLDEAADSLAVRLDTRWISAKMVSDWQAQAKLMCDIPGLLARDTQLLVGAGYRTAAQVHGATTDTLHRAILRFAETTDGKRATRNSSVPDLDTVKAWIKSAPAVVGKRDVA